MATKNEKNLPEAKFRAGAICATVWKNTTTNKEGKEVEYRSVSFERNYKDKNDEWKTTNSLRAADIPKAEVVLRKAYEFLVLRNNGIQEEVAC